MIGSLYRIKKNFSTAASVFKIGEILEFVDTTYSAYDSSSGFIFRSKLDNEFKTWFWHDDDPDLASEYFDLYNK